MKNKFLISILRYRSLLIVFLFASTTAQSQYVTIPDTNLLVFLKANFSTCFSGNRMDTTCGAIRKCKYLDFDYSGRDSNITNLDGVQYFDSLLILNFEYLNVSTIKRFPPQLQSFAGHGNPITSLPPIPKSVNSIYFNSHHLKQLPALPDSLISLDVRDGALESLPDLPPKLVSLSCEWNALSILPELPTGLTYLKCQYNKLKSLPKFPNTLFIAEVNNNLLDSLPELNLGIAILDCSRNKLINLPKLPNSLSAMYCSGNQLSVLPSLPTGLSVFHCDSNYLDSLPSILPNLQRLTCGFNHLKRLPALSPNLKTLECQNNQLLELPEIPSGLNQLNCSFNSLIQLPNSPKSLYILQCNNNQLKELPVLESDNFFILDCSYNKIKCFLPFPSNSTTGDPIVKIDHNLFTCLPNYTYGMDSLTLTYPICKETDIKENRYDCPCQISINGTAYLDANNNCEYDNNEKLLTNFPVSLRDNKKALLARKFTYANGKYEFSGFPSGLYYVTIDTVGLPVTVKCSPGTDSIVLQNSLKPVNQTVDFKLLCKPGFDYGVTSITPIGQLFPGRDHMLKIDAGDLAENFGYHCVSGIGGTISISISGKVKYLNHSDGIAPSQINGNDLVFDVADFSKSSFKSFIRLMMRIDTSAKATDSICVYVVLTSNSNGDVNLNNNRKRFCYKVFNSYDPNMKEVYPGNLAPGFDDWLTYTIHFQNTGNAPAYNIRLADTMDTNLDLETFQILSYSHPMQTAMYGHIVNFKFKDIMLPDSHSNSDSSQGYVQYRVKPKKGLPLGTKIRNTAYIYFDYNDPIVTNTTVNEYVKNQGSSIDKQSKQAIVNIFPNPSDGKVKVASSKPYLLVVSDITGKVLYSKKDLSEVDLEKGVYVFDVIIDGAHAIQKVIVY